MSHLSTKSHNDEVLKQLKPGDLVKFYRELYVHWGVYDGNGHIIHVTGSFIEELLKHKAEVKREDFYTVAEGHKAYIANENDERWLHLPAKVIVRRAKDSIGMWYYDFVFHNGVHFAQWCRYDQPKSEQPEEYFDFKAVEMTVMSVKSKVPLTVERSSDLGFWNGMHTVHNKKVLNALKPGDLVKFNRFFYYHWGVYEGDGVIIHVTASFIDAILENKAEVKRGDFLVVAGGDQADIGNEMDEIWKPLDPEEIVQRARDSIGQWNYSLFFNNCEHFAKWCRYDRKSAGDADVKFQFNQEEFTVLTVEFNQMQTVKMNTKKN